VQFVSVPEVGVPRIGVTSVGVFAKTNAPVPVSSVTAEARLALEGVARNVATPVPGVVVPRAVTPRAVSVLAAESAVTVLSAFTRIHVTALGFVSVKTAWPAVVPPRLARKAAKFAACMSVSTLAEVVKSLMGVCS
jgi:hypothetical protein